MKTIAPCNEIAMDFVLLAIFLIGQARLVGFNVMDRDVVTIKAQITARSDQPRRIV